MTERKEVRSTVATVSSMATFYLGEKLKLRDEDGGGWWIVVEVLPRDGYFARARIERITPSTEK